MSSTQAVKDAADTVRAYIDIDAPFKSLLELQEAIDKVTREEVRRARNLGAPWTSIAEQLGITRQTAVTRYGNTDTAN